MKAEIVATGTEILLGEIVDTNTSFLASELALLGIDIHFTSCVGDNPERFTEVLRQAWQRSDLVLTTGGLGPTQGDITRGVIAAFLGESPYVDEALKQLLVDYFARVGMGMPANNLKQAMLIPSAVALLNPFGTAPGWWVEKEGRIIIALPGPPGELQPMWRAQVLPRLRKRRGAIILSRILKTWGLSEGRVDELVSPYLKSANPTLGIYARQEGIALRITAKASTEDEARGMISPVETGVRAALGDCVWGADEDTIVGVLMQLLAKNGLTLGVAESTSGGLLTFTLGNAALNSDHFRGGIVLNGPEARAALGLEGYTAGASPVTAAALASLARTRLNADIGIGLDAAPVIDASAPAGGLAFGKVFVAVGTGRKDLDVVQDFSWRKSQLARRATNQALFMLRRILLSWR